MMGRNLLRWIIFASKEQQWLKATDAVLALHPNLRTAQLQTCKDSTKLRL